MSANGRDISRPLSFITADLSPALTGLLQHADNPFRRVRPAEGVLLIEDEEGHARDPQFVSLFRVSFDLGPRFIGEQARPQRISIQSGLRCNGDQRVEIADVAVGGYEVHETSLYGAKAVRDMRKGEVRIIDAYDRDDGATG